MAKFTKQGVRDLNDVGSSSRKRKNCKDGSCQECSQCYSNYVEEKMSGRLQWLDDLYDYDSKRKG